MFLHCSSTSASDLNKPPQEMYICVLIWRAREIYSVTATRDAPLRMSAGEASVRRQTHYIFRLSHNPFKVEYPTLLFSAKYILRIFHFLFFYMLQVFPDLIYSTFSKYRSYIHRGHDDSVPRRSVPLQSALFLLRFIYSIHSIYRMKGQDENITKLSINLYILFVFFLAIAFSFNGCS